MNEARHPVARAFVSAHLSATALPAFPGTLPDTLAEAYAIQKDGIALWPHEIVGWKVARIAPTLQPIVGAPRLIGPIFAGSIQNASGDSRFPMISGGGGALEAEIIVQMARDAPDSTAMLTPDDVRSLVGAVHIGIEIAGSAFSGNSAAGPIAMICGLGNSLGLIIGPEVMDWPHLQAQIRCVSRIDGAVVGEAELDPTLSAAFDALAFACNQARDIGHPIRAGQWISTGAITGVHRIAIGQNGAVDFGRHGRIECRVVPARPAPLPQIA